jgi:RNA polymerase sigma-70 factor, ECF subfamily
MAQADDWSWDRYRPLLKLQVRQLELDPRLQRRFDSSDLVQDALFQAIKNLDQCKGKTEAERIAWLQKLFHNKAIDRIREETAGKGDIRRGQSMDDAIMESSARWNRVLGNEHVRPDHEAERREFLLRVAAAMETLPEDQRDAVLLVQLMHVNVSKAAEQMGRTEKSVSGLVRRGLEKLRTLMPEYEPANL